MQYTPTDARNVALLSVATMAAGFLVLSFPYGGLPLAAFALGWVTYRFSPAHAAGLALTVATVVAVFGPTLLGTAVLDGLFVAVTLLAIGPVTAQLLQRFPALNVAFGVTLVVTAAFLVAPMGAETLALSKEFLVSLVAATATQQVASDPVALKAATDAMLQTFTQTWPGNAFYSMALGTFISIPLVARAGRLTEKTVNSYGPLADVDVSFHIVWPMILGLALTATGPLWSQAPAVLATIGENTLMIVRPILFLQGAAVFASLYRRMKAGRVTTAVGLLLLLLTELFIPSVSVIGAVDLFANLRKLPRAGSGQKVTAV